MLDQEVKQPPAFRQINGFIHFFVRQGLIQPKLASTCYKAKDDLEFLIYPTPPPKC